MISLWNGGRKTALAIITCQSLTAIGKYWHWRRYSTQNVDFPSLLSWLPLPPLCSQTLVVLSETSCLYSMSRKWHVRHYLTWGKRRLQFAELKLTPSTVNDRRNSTVLVVFDDKAVFLELLALPPGKAWRPIKSSPKPSILPTQNHRLSKVSVKLCYMALMHLNTHKYNGGIITMGQPKPCRGICYSDKISGNMSDTLPVPGYVRFGLARLGQLSVKCIEYALGLWFICHRQHATNIQLWQIGCTNGRNNQNILKMYLILV